MYRGRDGQVYFGLAVRYGGMPLEEEWYGKFLMGMSDDLPFFCKCSH